MGRNLNLPNGSQLRSLKCIFSPDKSFDRGVSSCLMICFIFRKYPSMTSLPTRPHLLLARVYVIVIVASIKGDKIRISFMLFNEYIYASHTAAYVTAFYLKRREWKTADKLQIGLRLTFFVSKRLEGVPKNLTCKNLFLCFC